jgi:hypothetical protein
MVAGQRTECLWESHPFVEDLLMYTRTLVRATVARAMAGSLALAAGVFVLAQPAPAPDKAPGTRLGDYQLSGPYTHANLTIFLVHGADRLPGKTFLTLPEALEQKQFIIHETQNVTQLTMENLSNEEVLILSGDILKGGQQDRIAQYDLIVPPRSGKLPLAAFCVEHTAARWMRPLQAEDGKFKASPGQVATNPLRLANRLHMSQAHVWKDVAGAQKQLSANLKVDVKAKESDSSLALSLQAKEVRQAADQYVQKLMPLIQSKPDVIGYAFAINGKVLCADVYGSSALFQKVWPRFLRANAIEAVAEHQKDKKFEPPMVTAVKAFLADAERGKAASRDLTKGLRQVTRESERNVLFETSAPEQKESWIRRNYLAK